MEEVVVSNDEISVKSDLLKGCEKNVFKGTVDDNFLWRKGVLFRDIKHIREVFTSYVVHGGYEVARMKNDKVRFTVGCAFKGCPFRLHASRLHDNMAFKVKTVNVEHTCERKVVENSEATPRWIYEHMKDQLRAQPNMPYSAMSSYLLEKFGLECKTWKLYNVKKHARLVIEGTHGEAYGKLIPYGRALLVNNLENVVKLTFQERADMNQPPTFKRMFFALKGLIDRFKMGCRPFFCLDGCHLTGPFKRTLMAATTLDANSGVYPIAWCVTEGETTESRTGFLENLRLCIGDNKDGVAHTIMSDTQKEMVPTSHNKTTCQRGATSKQKTMATKKVTSKTKGKTPDAQNDVFVAVGTKKGKRKASKSGVKKKIGRPKSSIPPHKSKNKQKKLPMNGAQASGVGSSSQPPFAGN